MIAYTEQYLAHHCIKGQKWGIRRYQNEDGSLTPEGLKRYGSEGFDSKKVKNKVIRKERETLIDKYTESDPRKAKRDALEEKTYELLSKYEFDGDDGGGGRTEADRKAGAKYMELSEQVAQLDREIEASAKEKAAKDLLDKYGSVKMKSVKNGDAARTAATGAAVVGLMVASPILLPVALGAAVVSLPVLAVGSAVDNAKKKKQERKNQNGKQTTE